tara:strand:+ start:5715 stop:6887 length:1173 start_codon:yes stop_codon:yes gene_type:complete
MQHLKETLVPAVLALANGEFFQGISLGSAGKAIGEVVFNTAMSGYQEILTDPSYAQQLVTLTCPHIGNTGVNSIDEESANIWASGLIIRDAALMTSNWRSQGSLSQYLKQYQRVAIAEIDTRHLVHVLRREGAQSGCIITDTDDPREALALAKSHTGLSGQDLARAVTVASSYSYSESDDWQSVPSQSEEITSSHHVVVYDFGVKRQILRQLVNRGCRITVVPATTTVDEVLSLSPQGVLFSNGPGDPQACEYAVSAAQALMDQSIPLLGICLGFQIIALACGAKTYKMKFGHHGANHPVKTLASHRVCMTSQNHGFAVDIDSLPSEVIPTHISLFDGSLQGMAHRVLPVLGFQGHPEASPGPHDIATIFDDFTNCMKTHKVVLCQKEMI